MLHRDIVLDWDLTTTGVECSGRHSEGAGGSRASAGKGGGVKGVQVGKEGGRWSGREDEADLAG